uniref:DNA-directed DNA polymerase n=1 Tax=Panagrellus redivivus TaxID=6233 RepID=A0A7E4UT16_PANRE
MPRFTVNHTFHRAVRGRPLAQNHGQVASSEHRHTNKPSQTASSNGNPAFRLQPRQQSDVDVGNYVNNVAAHFAGLKVADTRQRDEAPEERPTEKPKPVDFASMLSQVAVTPFDPDLEDDIPVTFSECPSPEPEKEDLLESSTTVEEPEKPDINTFWRVSLSKIMTEFELKKRIRAPHHIVDDTMVTCLRKSEKFAIFFVFGAVTDARLCFSVKPDKFTVGESYSLTLCVLLPEEMPHPLIQYVTQEVGSELDLKLFFDDGDIIIRDAVLQFHGVPMIPFRGGHFLHDACFGYVHVPGGEGPSLNDKTVTRSVKLDFMVSNTIVAYWAFVTQPEPEVVIEDAAIADYLFLEQKREQWYLTK